MSCSCIHGLLTVMGTLKPNDKDCLGDFQLESVLAVMAKGQLQWWPPAVRVRPLAAQRRRLRQALRKRLPDGFSADVQALADAGAACQC